MTINKAKEILSQIDGNNSLLFKEIHDQISDMRYEVEELPFPETFICFEEDYLMYFIHMFNNQIIPQRVIDIGCQYGFQSEIFKDHMQYFGIDAFKGKFFNTKLPNVQYYHETFPRISFALDNETVISNMSLGYFNAYVEGLTNDIIIEKLSKCKNLYIASTPDIIKALIKYFTKIEVFKFGEFPRYYMGK